MTVQEIIELDYREEDNRNVIQKYLKKIKPFTKYNNNEEVPFNKIEKLVGILSKKYNLRIRELAPDIWTADEGVIWKAVIINDTTNLTKCIIYGLSLYEVFAKTVIYMYLERKKV